MRLTEFTRDNVKVGSIISRTNEVLEITDIWETENGKRVTAKIINHIIDSFVGKSINDESLCWFYGMEIEK